MTISIDGTALDPGQQFGRVELAERKAVKPCFLTRCQTVKLRPPCVPQLDIEAMAHPGEPVGDAGALLGNLLEDSGPSVANDVVVTLHVDCRLAYTGSRRRCVE